MCSFTADGQKLNPFLIFSYERIPKTLRDSFPHERATLQNSPNGWMDTERCVKFLEHVSDEMKRLGTKLPDEKIILFWDGHASHMTLDVCEKAEELGIVLVALYPNSTFLIQPCDVAIFRSLKSFWRETVREAKFQELNKTITKAEFPHLFLQAFDKVETGTIKSGFEACGIYPWDKNSVDYDKCIGQRQHAVETSMVVRRETNDLEHSTCLSPDPQKR